MAVVQISNCFGWQVLVILRKLIQNKTIMLGFRTVAHPDAGYHLQLARVVILLRGQTRNAFQLLGLPFPTLLCFVRTRRFFEADELWLNSFD
jgi:hypothetical protein